MHAQLKIKSLLDQLNTVIVGKSVQVQDCVACLLAGGHLLIEDVPGVGQRGLAHAWHVLSISRCPPASRQATQSWTWTLLPTITVLS